MKKFFLHQYLKFRERFFDEKLEMNNKLSNLIMMCTVVGCFIAFLLSLLVNQDLFASLSILFAFVVLSFCLYLSAWKHEHKVAAILVVLLINEVVFPIMFVTSGGIQSGMVCWLILGLIFPFLVLERYVCVAIYILSFVTLGSMFVLEYFNLLPIPITPLQGGGLVVDLIQSMALVSLVFGVIFKFQSVLYTKQANELKQREIELKESMQKIEMANRAKSTFLANMSHEIRTPINAIMGMNEIILRDSDDKDVIQNSINIQNASNNLLSIVNDILDFSKIEEGKMEIIANDYSLSSLLVDCYNLIHLRAFNKGLSFNIVNNPNINERLYGDEFRIRQIGANLLSNAVKYTKEGSIELNVDYEPIDDETINVILAVRDTGVGISAEDKNLLFKSFQRIDEKNNRSIEGTGLGLTITARLIELMGGTIEVESEIGKGSCFKASIPQKIAGTEKLGDFNSRYAVSQNKEKKEEKDIFKAPGFRILVVDDVKTNLAVVKGLLKKTEVKLSTASSGDEMLDLCMKDKYDLIFLDHMMPEKDGIETFRELKSIGGINADTPVIALTANAIKGVEEQYYKEGFSGYLSKPVHGSDLENVIRKYID